MNNGKSMTNYLIIRNDASCLIFFGMQDGRPKKGDRSGLNACVSRILQCFHGIAGRKADTLVKDSALNR